MYCDTKLKYSHGNCIFQDQKLMLPPQCEQGFRHERANSLECALRTELAWREKLVIYVKKTNPQRKTETAGE